MVVCVFGESCTGKSTLADHLQKKLGGQIFSGRDYLRLAKSEPEARQRFARLLEERAAGGEPIIYVTTEIDHLTLLPENAVRVLATADLDIIKTRFAKRTGGKLPPPVERMLEQKHGMFDACARDYTYCGGDLETAVNTIITLPAAGK